MKNLILSLLMVCLLAPLAGHAEQKARLGQWDVHYMVVASSFLSPEVTRAYGIQRSKYNALVNISILDADSQAAQEAAVTGQAVNLLGVSKTLEFKQIKEDKAIYYIAVLPFRDQEQYRFEISLRQGNQNQVLRFEQKLYAD